MRGNGILTITLFFLALTGATSANAALGRKDALQIDWEIPVGAFRQENSNVEKSVVSFNIRLVPAQLWVADEPILSIEGTLLLPKGAQLYGMIGPRLIACSQDEFAQMYIGSKNRVCVVDDNGDGKFDAYFLRGMARSVTDRMWFAMNDSLPPNEGGIRTFSYSKKNPITAHQRPKIVWTLRPVSSGNVYLDLDIEDGSKFTSTCGIADYEVKPTEFRGPCGSPNIEVYAWELNKRARGERVEVKAPNRPLKVRFDVNPRLFGRLMAGMLVE